ncbi:MAG: hypothetical protein HOO67_06700 [Candidatus Peribacteraceae bacterium]|nr:hypothetical protein [Candidatus Peribacteraceae bacterium]
MAYQDLEPISKQLTIVVGLTVVGFMAFGLALSYYRNIIFDEHLLEIGRQNDELAIEIRSEQGDLDYYRSTQYKDKYAKETLGRLNPGEKALVITKQPKAPELSTSIEFTPTEQQQAAYDETLRETPVYQHWELFLFEREKIEELKRGI